MAFDQILEQGFLAVTENAAIAAAQTMGYGDHERSDRVAVEAMAQEKRLEEVGITDPGRIYRTEDLAPGDRLVFSCSGVTDGELFRGVRFFGGGSRTSTLFMSFASGIIRFVDTIRREEEGSPVRFR